jgi:hypothetical protein
MLQKNTSIQKRFQMVTEERPRRTLAPLFGEALRSQRNGSKGDGLGIGPLAEKKSARKGASLIPCAHRVIYTKDGQCPNFNIHTIHSSLILRFLVLDVQKRTDLVNSSQCRSSPVQVGFIALIMSGNLN